MTPHCHRIGIDIRYLSHGLFGGVHTYVRRLVPALLHAAPHLQFVLYADRKAPLDWQPPDGTTIRWLPYSGAVSSVVNDLRLARHMAADQIDVAHHLANYGFAPRGGCSVVTVHDVLNLQPVREGLRGLGNVSGLRTTAMVSYLSMMSRAAVRRATWLITISEDARQQIAAAAKWPLDRLTPIPHGAPFTEAELPDDETCAEIMRTQGLAPGFILGDAIKNPAVIISAWRRLAPELKQAHPLVFFSRRAELIAELAEAAERREARVIIKPDTITVRALYRQAAVFAFPSWIEGFGLPLLEAMTARTPVIASNRGAIPEVAGDAAILCDAEDVDAFEAGLNRLLTDMAERERFVARGAARVKLYSWERAASETIAVYEQAFARYGSAGGAA